MKTTIKSSSSISTTVIKYRDLELYMNTAIWGKDQQQLSKISLYIVADPLSTRKTVYIMYISKSKQGSVTCFPSKVCLQKA